MSSIYEKYAEAAINLEKQLDLKKEQPNHCTFIIPVGFGGAVVAELVKYAHSPYDGRDFLQNTVHASSKTKEIDEMKLSYRLYAAYVGRYFPVIYLDERTVSGEPGKMLKEKTAELVKKGGHFIKTEYAVLFDGGSKADMRGSNEKLVDEERLNWVGTKEEVEEYIYKKDGAWHYNLTPEIISRFNHVHDIKMEIDRFLLQ